MVAAFSNGSTQNNRLYLDGVEQQLSDAGGEPAGGADVTKRFFIGRYESDEGQGYKFAGTLDEVAVYNTQLSANRVMAHYQAAMRP